MKNLQKKLNCGSAGLMICVLMFAAATVPAQTYTLEQTAVAGGGMSGGAGGSYALDSTTGQTAAGNVLRANPFAMTVGFWNYHGALGSTAGNATVSGRIMTANGNGIRNVRLVLVGSSGETRYAQTGTLGYYRFHDLPVGEFYVLTVYSKRYVFAQPSIFINLTDDLTDVNFTALP